MPNQELTNSQKDQIAQVAANMAIENMFLTKRCYQNAANVLTGQKTADQIAAEIIERHANHAR